MTAFNWLYILVSMTPSAASTAMSPEGATYHENYLTDVL